MLRLSRSLIFVAALVAPGVLSAGETGSVRQGDIEVSGAWVRSTVPNRPAAGYMTLTNHGDVADRLVAVRAADVDTVELHQSSMVDGVMRMDPIQAVEVPAGGMAELKQGGMHVMMFGTGRLKPGGSTDLVLVFERAGEVTLAIPVLKRAPDGAMDHSGHSGQMKHSGHGAGSD